MALATPRSELQNENTKNFIDVDNVTDASYNFMVGLDRWQFKVILFWLGSLKLLLERHLNLLIDPFITVSILILF